jgi:phosphomannomutase
MGHETQPIDGDDFNACFVTLLRHLFESMGWINQEIASVGNITSNEALAGYLSTIRVSFEKVPVGVRELFAAIKKHQIGCYFESSGHGCLYFSEEIRNFLSGLREKSWQARLLLLLDGLSRNVFLLLP